MQRTDAFPLNPSKQGIHSYLGNCLGILLDQKIVLWKPCYRIVKIVVIKDTGVDRIETHIIIQTAIFAQCLVNQRK